MVTAKEIDDAIKEAVESSDFNEEVHNLVYEDYTNEVNDILDAKVKELLPEELTEEQWQKLAFDKTYAAATEALEKHTKGRAKAVRDSERDLKNERKASRAKKA